MHSLKYLQLMLSTCFAQALFAQFAPAANLAGTDAVFKDSPLINQWHSGEVVVDRGWVQYSDTALGRATFGEQLYILGEADGAVVSLGEAGFATLLLSSPLEDVSGNDFAVFENAFSHTYLELAEVSVSSDGDYFVAFPFVSLSPSSQQIGTFGAVEAEHLNNCAGKYIAQYGTPFDLSNLPEDPNLDINHIVAIRVKDLIGDISLENEDSEGNIFNDPWPTPFETSGFDLDAVAFLNPNFPLQMQEATVQEKGEIQDVKTIYGQSIAEYVNLPQENWPTGIYLVRYACCERYEKTGITR